MDQKNDQLKWKWWSFKWWTWVPVY